MNNKTASQIASLLNSYNKLTVNYTQEKVLSHQENYIFNLNNHELISTIECKKVQWYQYEFCHLTVNPKYRKQGQGEKILTKAILDVIDKGGRVVQCTIREGNVASSRLFLKCGFKKINIFYYPRSGNNVEIWQKVVSKKT